MTDNTSIDTRTDEEILANRPGFMLFFDKLRVFEKLSDARTGILFKAIIRYAEDGEILELNDEALDLLLGVIIPDLDAGAESYIHTCRTNRSNSLKGRNKSKKNRPTANDGNRPEPNININTTPNIEQEPKKEIEIDIENKDALYGTGVERPEMASLITALYACYPEEQKPSQSTASEIIRYFFDSYYEYFGKPHERIEPEVYANIIFPKLAEIQDSNECLYDAEWHDDDETLELYKDMIDDYFASDFKGKSNHSIIHFFSGKVRAIRFKNVRG